MKHIASIICLSFLIHGFIPIYIDSAIAARTGRHMVIYGGPTAVDLVPVANRSNILIVENVRSDYLEYMKQINPQLKIFKYYNSWVYTKDIYDVVFMDVFGNQFGNKFVADANDSAGWPPENIINPWAVNMIRLTKCIRASYIKVIMIWDKKILLSGFEVLKRKIFSL